MTLRDGDDPAARASEETRTRQDGREIWRDMERAIRGEGVKQCKRIEDVGISLEDV